VEENEVESEEETPEYIEEYDADYKLTKFGELKLNAKLFFKKQKKRASRHLDQKFPRISACVQFAISFLVMYQIPLIAFYSIVFESIWRSFCNTPDNVHLSRVTVDLVFFSGKGSPFLQIVQKRCSRHFG